MNRRYLPMLVLLALIWGSSFMFIKIAVRELNPATLVFGRLGIAALALAAYVFLTVGRSAVVAGVRGHWPALLAVGLLNTAVPFWLLSWGETRIDSGLASIIQASVPIFNALLAFGFFHDQRVTGARLLGVAVGFVGVALLVGAQPQAKVLGAIAVVGMATCYAAGGLLARRYLSEVRPQVVALGTTTIAALAVTPAGVALAPHHVPHLKTFASIAVLGIVATAGAYLLFYTLIAGAGAAYASLVTYLVPPIALAYGSIFLDERFGWPAFAGLALILGGVGLGTWTRRDRRKTSALAVAD
ncbi:MAG: DMT family transporter [Actinobacteria bacterium]|nr:DMT family transporter [Actinomycetota bacterium]